MRLPVPILALVLVFVGVLVVVPFPRGREAQKNRQFALGAGRLKEIAQGINEFRAYYGRLPSGTNRDVMAVLAGANREGQNPEQRRFLMFRGSNMYDAQGRVLDDWGNPLVFGPVGRGSLRIYSFGPNRTDDGGWRDDLIVIVRASTPEVIGPTRGESLTER